LDSDGDDDKIIIKKNKAGIVSVIYNIILLTLERKTNLQLLKGETVAQMKKNWMKKVKKSIRSTRKNTKRRKRKRRWIPC